MKKQKIKHLSLSGILLASFITGAFGVAVGTFIVSAHGGDATKIHACKTNSSGTLRVVGENDDCRSNETALDWNTQGLPGEPGPTGVPGGGGSVTGIHGKQSKALANNANTDLFTFPLAAEEQSQLHIKGNILAKKDADWAVFFYEGSIVMYNDNGTLRVIEQVTFQKTKSKNVGSSINFDAAFNAMDFSTFFTPDLTAGVVTVNANPGDIGATPDIMEMNYTMENPSGNSITFLP